MGKDEAAPSYLIKYSYFNYIFVVFLEERSEETGEEQKHIYDSM